MDFMNRPEEYAVANAIPYRGTSDIVNEFSGELKKMHGKIIDIGCGPGNVTYELVLPRVDDEAIIVGADISQSMIDYANKFYKNEKRLSFIELNIQANELPESVIGQFDNALSFYCLQWCAEKEITMKNIYKLLKPGGKGLIVLISNHYLFDILSEQLKNSEYSVYMKDVPNWMPPHQNLPHPEQTVREDLENAGFKVLHCSNREKICSWKNLQALLDLMKTVNPFTDKIPEALQKKYWDDFGKKFVDKFLTDEKKNDYKNSVIDDRYSIVVAYFEK